MAAARRPAAERTGRRNDIVASRYITNWTCWRPHAMDNLTHTLFAVTLGRTPLGRAGRGTTTALVLASNAPDIDIVTTAQGGAAYLQWHRGPPHGPRGIAALALVTAAMVWGIQRYIDRRSDPPD